MIVPLFWLWLFQVVRSTKNNGLSLILKLDTRLLLKIPRHMIKNTYNRFIFVISANKKEIVDFFNFSTENFNQTVLFHFCTSSFLLRSWLLSLFGPLRFRLLLLLPFVIKSNKTPSSSISLFSLIKI